jgi:hypothetical protein
VSPLTFVAVIIAAAVLCWAIFHNPCRAAVRSSGPAQNRRCGRPAIVVAYGRYPRSLGRCEYHRTAPAYRRPRSNLGAGPMTGGSLWVVSFLLPPAERKCWSAEVRSVLWESRGDRLVQRQQVRGFLWALPATIWTSWMVVVLGAMRPRREFR